MTFELNGTTYHTDAETLGVIRSVFPDAMQTGDTSALQAIMELGLMAGRIVTVDGKPMA